ncbi:MAG TPA: hypothetical protein HA348_05720 [Thermoplasmata archaeon]|nr:hypothetical protein [Thermoplasmata archaeon]
MEKLPENRIGEKVCAGGLSPKIIDRVPKKFIERYIRSINVHSPSFEKWILEGGEPFIGMISRLELGQWQLDQALKAGAKLEDKEEVRSVDLSKKQSKPEKAKNRGITN